MAIGDVSKRRKRPVKPVLSQPPIQRRSLRREALRARASPAAGTRPTGRREGPIAEITIRLIY